MIYERNQDHILPFIGEAFTSARPEQLRVVVVGINAYVSEGDWDHKSAEWFRTGFAEQRHRFDKRVLSEVSELALGLTSAGRALAGRVFEGSKSMYVTNAIKVYVREHEGKRASQVAAQLGRYLDQWRDEMETMMELRLTPHLIVVMGGPFWPHMCRSFRDGGVLCQQVAEYRPTQGETLHHLNRIVLSDGQRVVLVRLRHPAARTPKGSAAWLLANAEV
jgi:hypothetical protein